MRRGEATAAFGAPPLSAGVRIARAGIRGEGPGRAHILVVNDVAPVRSFFSALLSRAGYRVSTASDGTEALARCRREPPDLMLLGARIASPSGVEVAEALHGTVPFLMQCARPDTDLDLPRFRRLGALGTLTAEHSIVNEVEQALAFSRRR